MPSIQVSDWGDDGAMIEVDVLIRVLADCQPDPDGPPYAVQLVEGIMDGGADSLPDLPPGTTPYHRRIPPWGGR